MSNKCIDYNWLDLVMFAMSSMVSEMDDFLNDDTIKCSETIGTVERDIENKQLEMDRMKERVARLRTIIQQRKNHLSHLKRLKKRR